jgi:hypothetical protein
MQMYRLAQMVADGYVAGPPSLEAEQIDAQIAERMLCRKCGSPMRYEAYHKRNGAYCSYIALAVCDRCGHQIAF